MQSTYQWRAIRGELALGAFAAAAVGVLAVRDPHEYAAYGLCPFHEMTGWWCPGCGGLRAVNDLTRGDLVASLHSNVLLLPIAVTALVVWGRSVWWRWHGSSTRPGLVLSRTWLVSLGIGLTVFTVLRNTAWGQWLAPVG